MSNDVQFLETCEVLLDSKYAKILYSATYEAIICVAVADFIPKNEFEPIFRQAGTEIKAKNAKRMVFDKRNFKIFDQPSMIWYHIILKPEIKATTGMVTYRKLLPDDKTFRMSVEIGRKHIKTHNPEFNFEDFDIKYMDSMEEALTK